jgi:hypothetical protein
MLVAKTIRQQMRGKAFWTGGFAACPEVCGEEIAWKQMHPRAILKPWSLQKANEP